MKKALFLFFFCIVLASAGPELSFAQATPAPEAQAEPAKEAPAPAKKRKARRKPPRTDSAAAGPAVSAPKPVEPKRVNSLLFGTMEKLETLIALHENLSLRVSEDTLNKISSTEKAANKAAAAYFKAEQPGEAAKPYRELLDSALRSVKALKDVKDRIRPEESEEAILLCRDLNAAVDSELAGAKLSAGARDAAAEPAPQAEEQAASPEAVTNEAAAVSALADLRKAVEAYKTKETKYPKNLARLAPKYIPALPEIQLADHPATRDVLVIDSSDYDEAVFQAITDTGKWLYFTDKKSKYYGSVFIDCSHKDASGEELYKAGR